MNANEFIPFPREIWDKGINLSQSAFKLLGFFIIASIKNKSSDHLFTNEALLNVSGLGSESSLREARLTLSANGWVSFAVHGNPRYGYSYHVHLPLYEPSVKRHSRGKRLNGASAEAVDTQPVKMPEVEVVALEVAVERKLTPQQVYVKTLAEVMHLDKAIDGVDPLALYGNGDRRRGFGRLARECKLLIEQNVTTEQLEVFATWWYSTYFRGRQGISPSFADIKKFLPAALSWYRSFKGNIGTGIPVKEASRSFQIQNLQASVSAVDALKEEIFNAGKNK